MKIGEVCLLTNNVIRLANFYRKLFELNDYSDDDIHQVIISEGTGFTIFNDGKERANNFQNICLAFTVDDVDIEFERLTKLGIKIIAPPTARPWGAKNMSFCDPDGNYIFFRSFLKQGEVLL